jgi:hypothetical protein
LNKSPKLFIIRLLKNMTNKWDNLLEPDSIAAAASVNLATSRLSSESSSAVKSSDIGGDDDVAEELVTDSN